MSGLGLGHGRRERERNLEEIDSDSFASKKRRVPQGGNECKESDAISFEETLRHVRAAASTKKSAVIGTFLSSSSASSSTRSSIQSFPASMDTDHIIKSEKEIHENNNNRDDEKEEEEVVEEDKRVADFGLTGALANDTRTGNMTNGVRLKYSEPVDRRLQEKGRWRLYVFRKKRQNSGDRDKEIETINLDGQTMFMIGRDELVAHIPTLHDSCSKQHAVIQFKTSISALSSSSKSSIGMPYIIDLESTNKTQLNGRVIEESRFYELRHQDNLQFGASSREYILIDTFIKS